MPLDYIEDAVDNVTAVTAERVNKLRDQGRPRFTTTAARGTAIPSPEDGQSVYMATNDADEGPYEWHTEDEWRRPWNMPWGFVASASRSTLQTGVSTSFVDLTGLSVTFAAVANRRYEVRAKFLVEKATTTNLVDVILANAANTQLENMGTLKMSPFDLFTFFPSAFVGSIGAGTQTLKLRGICGSGTFNVRSDASISRIWVLDVGPDGAPA
jgi:hypothetical protein